LFDVPRLGASSIWTVRDKVLFMFQDGCSLRVLLALDRKPIVYMTVLNKLCKKRNPNIFTFSARFEGVCITYHDECIPCPGQKDIESLRCGHEPNIGPFIAASERRNDDLALFTLVIIYGSQPL